MNDRPWETFWRQEDNRDWWKRPAPEILAWMKALSPRTHPRVLDLGCGLGRHAIAFALAGYKVTATDASDSGIDYLQDWAERLGLDIATNVCDMLDQPFPPGAFDIVVSYNVLYHGTRERFAQAIALVHDLLRPGGLFFLTCPTREDGKYGHGECVALHTYAASKSIIPGDIHYFCDRPDLERLLERFAIQSIDKDEGFWDNKGEAQFYSHWRAVVKRRD